MSDLNPYARAVEKMKQHPTSGGSVALAKAILSLFNDQYCFSIRECLDGRDSELTVIMIEMVVDYAQRGETEDLRSAGREANDYYPKLWDIASAGDEAKYIARRA